MTHRCEARPGPAWAAAAAAGLALALAITVSGCGGRGATVRLVDGTSPPATPAPLRHLGDGLRVSRVRVAAVARLSEWARRCARSFRHEFDVPGSTRAVERLSVLGASVTLADRRRRALLACDRTGAAGQGAPGGGCGRAVGRLFAGRLRDPRVDLLCRDEDGRQVAFAWIEPGPHARWLLVREGTWAAVEPVAGGLPARVATRSIDLDAATADFHVEEYDAAGALLRRYTLHARVAG